MRIHGPSLSLSSSGFSKPFQRVESNNWNNLKRRNITLNRVCSSDNVHGGVVGVTLNLIGNFLATSAMITSVATTDARESTTLSNIPQTLSGECRLIKDCKKPRIQKPKSRKAESCTIKCVTTCIRGGDGSPGEGPLNVRRPVVVFKQGFRTRQYCLVECSDICNLISDTDDGP